MCVFVSVNVRASLVYMCMMCECVWYRAEQVVSHSRHSDHSDTHTTHLTATTKSSIEIPFCIHSVYLYI